MSKHNTIKGCQCHRCYFKFKLEETVEIAYAYLSKESPAEYVKACPNCKRILNSLDAADLEVDEAGFIL
jgi:NAD-dependent SIR2 family protein deacetylase